MILVREDSDEDDQSGASAGAEKGSVPFFANLVYSSPHRND